MFFTFELKKNDEVAETSEYGEPTHHASIFFQRLMSIRMQLQPYLRNHHSWKTSHEILSRNCNSYLRDADLLAVPDCSLLG